MRRLLAAARCAFAVRAARLFGDARRSRVFVTRRRRLRPRQNCRSLRARRHNGGVFFLALSAPPPSSAFALAYAFSRARRAKATDRNIDEYFRRAFAAIARLSLAAGRRARCVAATAPIASLHHRRRRRGSSLGHNQLAFFTSPQPPHFILSVFTRPPRNRRARLCAKRLLISSIYPRSRSKVRISENKTRLCIL